MVSSDSWVWKKYQKLYIHIYCYSHFFTYLQYQYTILTFSTKYIISVAYYLEY